MGYRLILPSVLSEVERPAQGERTERPSALVRPPIPEPDWEALGICFPLDLRELPWACARLEQAGYDAWVEDDGWQLVLRYRLNTQTKGGER